MNPVSFDRVKKDVNSFGWYSFSNSEWNCPGYSEELLQEYVQKHQLPSPCNKCFKGIIFWHEDFSKELIELFFDLLYSMNKKYFGKLNEEKIEFFFKSKEELLSFIVSLCRKLEDRGIEVTYKWKRACRQFRDKMPELWSDTKTFIPDP